MSAVHDAPVTLAVFRVVAVEELHVDLESLQQLVLATRDIDVTSVNMTSQDDYETTLDI